MNFNITNKRPSKEAKRNEIHRRVSKGEEFSLVVHVETKSKKGKAFLLKNVGHLKLHIPWILTRQIAKQDKWQVHST